MFYTQNTENTFILIFLMGIGLIFLPGFIVYLASISDQLSPLF